MHWVIQENIANEERHQDVIDTLERFDIPYTLVKVVPFAHTLEPDVEIDGPVMTIGSVALTNKIAKRKGWKPGGFTNSNFDYRVWSTKWKGKILNEDAIVCSFREIPLNWNQFFIRPVLDNKAFSGTIMDFHEYQKWLGRLMVEEGASDLHFDLDEVCCVGPLKKIYREHRFFVVNGEAVTASTYKIGDRVVYQDESTIDRDAWFFVSGLVSAISTDCWNPAYAFAVDIALTDDGYKVIEINCINSSGFYKADVQKLIMALDGAKYRLEHLDGYGACPE